MLLSREKIGEEGMQDCSTGHCLLRQVEKQELEAQEFGFFWENFHQLIQQIQSECVEIQEAWTKGNSLHLQEEIGDLIQATVSLAVGCRF
jgi:NTP pyrophosphatase (non-canonical NTP hydrolase)